MPKVADCLRGRSNRRAWYLASVATLVLGWSASSASAQASLSGTAASNATPPGAAVNASAQNPNALSEVVVTARRKVENLQNVPLAITALSAQDLSAASATSLQDITFLTPGLTYTSNGQEANALPVIRGLSDTSGGEAASTNVSIFLDGIYVSDPSAIDFDLGGLDRVEVVKGPVSGLYGRNAFTGAINYVTAKPTNAYHADISATLGDYGRTIIQGGASGPIYGDILKGAINYSYNHLDGTFTDPVSHLDSNGHNKDDVLATLLFTPDSHITITPVVYYGEDHFNDPTVVSYNQNCALGTNNSYCGSLNHNQLGPFVPADAGSGASGLSRRVEHVHVDSRFTYDFGTLDVLFGFNHVGTKSINSFTGTENGLIYDLYSSTANNPFAGSPVLGTAAAQSFFGDVASEKDSSVELRYDTPQDYFIRFSVGGYYFHQVTTNTNTFGIDGANIPAGEAVNFIAQSYVTSNGQSAKALNFAKAGARDYSPYISGEWDIVRNLTLSAAVRSTEEEQTIEGVNFATPNEKNFHSFTSNQALTWKPNPHVSLYVSAANGEKSGGFNYEGVLPQDQSYNPETDWDYEGGIKTTLLEGHLRANLAVFHTDVNNQQVIGPQSPSCPVATNSNCIGDVIKNIGSYSVTGVEADADWVVGGGLKINAGISYNPARFDSGSYDFNDGPSCALVPSCASSRLVTVQGQQADNVKGLRPPFESDVTFNLTAEYRRPLGFAIGPLQNVDYFLRGDYRYESTQFTVVNDFADYGPRNVFNFHAGLTNGTWSLTGYVLNITNDQTPVGEQEEGSLNGFDAAASGRFNSPPNGFGVTWVPVAALPEGRTYAFRLAYHY